MTFLKIFFHATVNKPTLVRIRQTSYCNRRDPSDATAQIVFQVLT